MKLELTRETLTRLNSVEISALQGGTDGGDWCGVTRFGGGCLPRTFLRCTAPQIDLF